MSVSIEEQILVTRAVLETLEDVATMAEREDRMLANIRKYRSSLYQIIGLLDQANSKPDVARARRVAEDALAVSDEIEEPE